MTGVRRSQRGEEAEWLTTHLARRPSGQRNPPSWIKPAIIGFVAAFTLLACAFAVLAMLAPSKTDGAAETGEGKGTEAGESDFMKSFIAFFRDSCVTSAKATLTQKGIDPSSTA